MIDMSTSPMVLWISLKCLEYPVSPAKYIVLVLVFIEKLPHNTSLKSTKKIKVNVNPIKSEVKKKQS